MKELLKRVFSLFLCTMMCLSLLPVVHAHGEETEEETPVVVLEAGETGDGEDGTPSTESEAAAEPLRVEFVCTPEELSLTVYGEEEEVIEPQEDGSYLLLPGKYFYDAACEGYVSAERTAFEVEAGPETIEITIVLNAQAVTTEKNLKDSRAEVPLSETSLVESEFAIAATTSSSLTASEVTSKLDSIKSNTYPAGSYYTGTFGGGSECYAFGRLLANEVFGSYPWNCSAYSNGYTDSNGWKLIIGPTSETVIEPGDIIEVRTTGQHTAIVWKLSGSTIYVAECWGSQGGKVAWGYFNGSSANSTLSGIISTYGQANVYVWKRPGATNSTGSYLDQCTPYPAYLELTVKNSCVLKTLPCSGSETNPDSKTIRSGVVGEKLTATGLYKNTAGNYWYKVNVDGQTGYIYAGDATVSKKLSSISYSGKALPTNLPSGQSYAVDWTINSSYLNLKNIDGYIYSGSNLSTERYHGQITNVNATSKNLNYSAVDNALLFNKLEDGTYKLVIKASVTNYYSTNGSSLSSVELSGTPISCVFTVGSSHTHSYTDTVVAPTCTEAGYTLHSCSCGYSYKDTTVTAKGHSYTSTVTKAATCTASGTRTYRCSTCGDTYTETISALGHSYTAQTIAGSCTQRPATKYTCSRCGDTYTEYASGNWSEWSTEKPASVPESAIESKTQYRYRQKETTTSSNSSLAGWTLAGSETVWSDYGPWSAWGTSAISASESTQVETASVYGYYYFLCPNCGAHMHGYGTCYTWAGGCGASTSSSGWTMCYSTLSWSNANLKDWYGTGKYYTTSLDGGIWFKWEDGSPHTGYRSRTRTQSTVYNFYRWTDWTDWSDTQVTASDTMEIETRQVYRYDLYATAQHSWNSGTITKAAGCETSGTKTYTCTVCGETKTETIAATGHKWGAWTLTTAPTLTADGVETRSCQNSGCGKTETRAVAAVIYTVRFDANGGTGAPASQKKLQGSALTLSSIKPTRSGYTFQGWATSATATTARYQPGGSFTTDADTTLYAVWKQDVTEQGTLSVSSAYGVPGKEVSLGISINDNPGIAAISLQISYDKTRLSLTGYEDSGLRDWTVGVGAGEKAVWVDEKGSTVSGEVLILTFKVLDDAVEGFAEVSLTNILAADVNDQKVVLSAIDGGITVTTRVPGDCNGDGGVDIFDLLMLKKHLAGISTSINLQNADVNGDNDTDVFDLLLLKKYLAGTGVVLK